MKSIRYIWVYVICTHIFCHYILYYCHVIILTSCSSVNWTICNCRGNSPGCNSYCMCVCVMLCICYIYVWYMHIDNMPVYILYNKHNMFIMCTVTYIILRNNRKTFIFQMHTKHFPPNTKWLKLYNLSQPQWNKTRNE